MKSVLDKNKKKEDEQLLKAKELKEKIESMKNDLECKTKLICLLKEQRENKIENIKKLEIENKSNYKHFLSEYENILNNYKVIEKEIHEMLNDLKMLLQLKKEKENILSDKNLVLEAKKKELDKKVDGVELEIMNNSYMINDVLKKVREIFKKTHVQYEYEEDLKPLLIRLQHININSDEIK
ncbi:hypothetical protein CYL21_3019 [Plasmodium falciparum NF54]|uniref:Uncharacterized protein n=2 Tax=Plasmodium falciparum TaxID=5833 RepID=Q9NF98_PLAF7|nr:conserved Plasmodium protein, unknown function [Plasmodium falciparum 3D7]KAF4328810.1 hypothetical protein CYL21_3019 [Plasmodium falciparum NF54]PKC45302.1 hypothetical protein CK202_3652 [Plasmodium falciparum NF54]CAB92305.1 conserved Plasmodium protein, unknown function [Plasmodium falciparum 3D7]|eukprot:XP_001351299.1 conserved Plasmodium protein, unknown function [Plasmodium falciparum 3D7]